MSTLTKISPILILLIVVFVGLIFLRNNAIQTSPENIQKKEAAISFPKDYQIAAWVWHSPDQMSQTHIEELFEFSKSQGINTLYISIDRYVDLYELPTSETKDQRLHDFDNRLAMFIDQANQNDIKIQALAGDTLWANSSHRYIPNLLLDYVIQFNKTHLYKFSGIQFDIEFYNQPNFAKDSKNLSLEYLTLVQELTRKLDSQNVTNPPVELDFGLAIPPSIGQEKSQAPLVEWGGKTKPVGQHIVDIIKDYQRSYLVLMSYRNETAGDNGSIAISKPLMVYSDQQETPISVLVGLETGEVKDKHITFFEQNKENVKVAANEIAKSFSESSSFKGLAIHDLYSFKDLRD